MIKQAVAEVLTPEMRSQEGASRSNAANSRWSERILTLMADDVRSAENVLRQHGFTRQQALSYVKKSTLGAIQYQPNIPSILKDPTQAPYAALQMLLLAEHIESADPYSVQIGRIWGVTDMGMRFPDIARKVIEWNMGVISGPGGRRENDLTRTLRTLLEINPTLTVDDVLDYFGVDNEDALDRYHSTTQKTVFITAVEDAGNGIITYTDSTGRNVEIKKESLSRRLRQLQSG